MSQLVIAFAGPVGVYIGVSLGLLFVVKRMLRIGWIDVAKMLRIPLRRPALIATVFLVGWLYWMIRDVIHERNAKENRS